MDDSGHRRPRSDRRVYCRRFTPLRRIFAVDALAAIAHLADFPNSGKHLREIENPSVREVVFGTYRIIYRVKPELVEVLTVYHGARLLDPTRIE